jgi:hypothetical protein
MTKSITKPQTAVKLRKGDAPSRPNSKESKEVAEVNWWEQLGSRVTTLTAEFRKKYGKKWSDEYYRHKGEAVRMGIAAYEDIKEEIGDVDESEFTKRLVQMPLGKRIAFLLASAGSAEFDPSELIHLG